MKRVSVIVPTYNVENVIERSVKSLLSQTLHDFEIVYVDDCSIDSTYNILNEVAKNKIRNDIDIKIIRHEENQGVAVARNTGLNNAEGEYVYYVDADDYCDENTLQLMYDEAIQQQCDVVGCEWLLSFEKNARHMVQPDVKTGIEAFEKMCNGVMRWNLWLFMVRRSLYEEHKFRFIAKENMGEDMMVMMKILLNVKSVSILHRPLYHYIQTNSNAMTKNFSAYRSQVTANVLEVERYIKECFESCEYLKSLNQLKLTLKLPLLISDKVSDFQMWQEWFPESNIYIGQNVDQPFRTILIQKWAATKCYWLLKIYYRIVIKFIYGIIYK